MNLQRNREFGLAALLTALVLGADFMDAKVYILLDQSGVRYDSRAINQLLPIA